MYPSNEHLRLGTAKLAADILSITSEHWAWKRNLRRVHSVHSALPVIAEKPAMRSKLVLKNGGHHNFHDLAIIVPIVGRWLGMLGRKLKDPARALKAVNDTTATFLAISFGIVVPQWHAAVEGDMFEDIVRDGAVWDGYHEEFKRHEKIH